MYSTEPVEEMLQCFDGDRNPTEARPRPEVKAKPHRYWYGVTKIWLVNDAGEILCTRRSSLCAANPDKWQSYVGGHVSAGDTFIGCAVKEIGEEVGILMQEDQLTLLEEGRNDVSHNFYACYAAHCTRSVDSLEFVDREVSEAKWMSIADYLADEAAHPEQWCNGITPERQQKLREWFAQ